MELGLTTPMAGMGLIDEEPVHARFDIPDARLVARPRPARPCSTSGSAPGDRPDAPLVSTEVDRQAVELIAEWIRGLPPVEPKVGRAP